MDNVPRASESQGNGRSLFGAVEKKLSIEALFEEGFPVKHLPKIVFVLVLALMYIGNTHHVEKTVRRIERLQSDVEDLRADYTTLSADLMLATKQSEVARRVKDYGIVESSNPPIKIAVKKGEY